MSGSITVDTAALAAGAQKVGALALDAESAASGSGAPGLSFGAAQAIEGATSAPVLEEIARALIDAASGLQESLSGFSAGLTAAARSYRQVDADAADRAAAGATVEIVL